jgi:hypothetical protein
MMIFKFGMHLADVADDPLARINFTILFGVAVGIGDGFRSQRQDLAHIRIEYHRL